MEAPAHKKQKKAHSVAVVAAGGAAAAAAAAPAVPASGWASLNPELIGTLSKFLDLPMPAPSADKKDGENAPTKVNASAAGNGKLDDELMNLCLVAGSKTATSIRHTYLRDNETFLLYSMLMAAPLLYIDGDDEDAQATCTLLIKGRANIRQWMEVNQDWKKRCSEPKKFKQFQENATKRIMFPHCIAQEALEFEPVGGRFLQLKSVDKRFYDSESELHAGRVCDLIGHYLISVENARGVTRFAMHGESFNDVLDELEMESSATEDGQGFDPSSYLKVKFLRNPCVMFGNPSIAAELGLVEVVNFLIEEKGLDVNGTWDGLHAWDQPHALPMIACSLSPDISVLKYILAVPGADFGFQLDSWPAGTANLSGGTLIHWLMCPSDIEVDYLEALLRHQTIDINARLPANGVTALHLLCMGDHPVDDVDKMRLLLKHGADIHCRTSEESGGVTPLEFLYMFKPESNEYWEQKAALLNQASGAKS